MERFIGREGEDRLDGVKGCWRGMKWDGVFVLVWSKDRWRVGHYGNRTRGFESEFRVLKLDGIEHLDQAMIEDRWA